MCSSFHLTLIIFVVFRFHIIFVSSINIFFFLSFEAFYILCYKVPLITVLPVLRGSPVEIPVFNSLLLL